MSKITLPQEKKRLSLERDRRNVYGENAKSSRKNIAKGKHLSQKAQRRAGAVPLSMVKGEVSEEESLKAELDSRDGLIRKAHTAFTKRPDAPLAEVLARKARKRASQNGAGAKKV
jgi:hypothetical protein